MQNSKMIKDATKSQDSGELELDLKAGPLLLVLETVLFLVLQCQWVAEDLAKDSSTSPIRNRKCRKNTGAPNL